MLKIGLVTFILAPITSRPFVNKAKSMGGEEVEVKGPPNEWHSGTA